MIPCLGIGEGSRRICESTGNVDMACIMVRERQAVEGLHQAFEKSSKGTGGGTYCWKLAGQFCESLEIRRISVTRAAILKLHSTGRTDLRSAQYSPTLNFSWPTVLPT